MTVTNQERIREIRGQSLHVQGGGLLKAINLHIYAQNVTVDALAIVEASLKGQNFKHDGNVLFSIYQYMYLLLFFNMFNRFLYDTSAWHNISCARD